VRLPLPVGVFEQDIRIRLRRGVRTTVSTDDIYIHTPRLRLPSPPHPPTPFRQEVSKRNAELRRSRSDPSTHPLPAGGEQKERGAETQPVGSIHPPERIKAAGPLPSSRFATPSANRTPELASLAAPLLDKRRGVAGSRSAAGAG
jgi:hypothetical protein